MKKSLLRYSKLGRPNPRTTSGVWSDEVIKSIIHNQSYIGRLVQLRTTTISPKNHKIISKDESEWAVIENDHEPIIFQELWDRCIEIDNSCSRGKSTKQGVTLPLSGFCYCADCVHKMRQTVEPSAYICGRYSKSGRTVCSTHYIRVKMLEEVILADIRPMLKLTVDEEKARKYFLKRKSGTIAVQTAENTRKIKQAEKCLTELEKLIRSVYEDKVMGRVAENIAVN